MIDDEGAHGRKLCEGVRPRLRGETRGEVSQYVTAGVMAERHEERGEQHVVPRAPAQAGGQPVGRAHERVLAAASPQRGLEQSERRLALDPAMPRERDEAPGSRGQRGVQGGGDGGGAPSSASRGGASRSSSKPDAATRTADAAARCR